jgi:hypothetical protein
MQILFAAPFLLAAGLAFTILSLIPRARQWAIPIPTGIIAAGPSLLIVIIIEGLIVSGFLKYDWAPGWGVVLFWSLGGIGGAIGGVLSAMLASFVANVLPAVLLRVAVVLAAWCSYSAMLVTVLFVFGLWSGINNHFAYLSSEGLALLLELLLSFIGAVFVAQNAEQFRSKRIHLPCGMPFRRRGPRPPTPAPSAR